MSIILGLLTAVVPIAVLWMTVQTFVGKSKLKFTHRMLAIYLGVLLLATALVPFVKKNAQVLERMDQLESNRAWSQLNTKLSHGQLEQVDPAYLLAEKSIDLKQADHIWPQFDHDHDILVYVERKEENDDRLDAFVFSEGLWIDGYDFSHEQEPVRISLQPDNSLYIVPPTNQHIKVGLISDIFLLKQIKQEPSLTHVTSGGQTVYLRIPRDLSISTGEHVNIQMVDKVRSD